MIATAKQLLHQVPAAWRRLMLSGIWLTASNSYTAAQWASTVEMVSMPSKVWQEDGASSEPLKASLATPCPSLLAWLQSPIIAQRSRGDIGFSEVLLKARALDVIEYHIFQGRGLFETDARGRTTVMAICMAKGIQPKTSVKWLRAIRIHPDCVAAFLNAQTHGRRESALHKAVEAHAADELVAELVADVRVNIACRDTSNNIPLKKAVRWVPHDKPWPQHVLLLQREWITSSWSTVLQRRVPKKK